MAFPQIANSGVGGGAGNSTSVTLTFSAVSGKPLLVIFGKDGIDAVTSISGTGWAQIGTVPETAAMWGAVYWKVADGDDALTVNYATGTETTRYIALQIDGWEGTSPPEVAYFSNVQAGAVSTTPDPPSLSPSWGAADTLWIAAYIWDNSTRLHVAYPSGYTSNQITDGSVSSSAVGVAASTREANTATENPGAGEISSEEQWLAITIAVRGMADGGGPVSTTVAVTDAGDIASVTGVSGDGSVSVSVAVTDAGDTVAVTGAVPTGGDVRLQLGVDAERGGVYASITGIEYWVYGADRASVIAHGTTLATDGTGVTFIDVLDSPYEIGDNVLVSMLKETSETSVLDRTLRSGFFYVPAIAIPE